MVGENAPPREGWAPPYREHCGEWHQSIECPTCQQTIPLVMPDCERGEN